MRNKSQKSPSSLRGLVFQITQKVFCQNASPLAVDFTRGGEQNQSNFFCCALLSLFLNGETLGKKIHSITQTEPIHLSHILINRYYFSLEFILKVSIYWFFQGQDIVCSKLLDYLMLKSLPMIKPQRTKQGSCTKRNRFSALWHIRTEDELLWRSQLWPCSRSHAGFCFAHKLEKIVSI